jgi:2-aminoethylphosphonate-pyruvate transaminase
VTPGPAHPDPLLLTPGPLTTRPAVRAAMDRDWGSRDAAFISLTAELRRRLLDVVNGAETHVAVPIQGPGTYAVEAAVGTLVGLRGKLLVLVNGAYGERIARIARGLGRAVVTLSFAEDEPVDPAQVAAALAADPAITRVALVHCETTTGLLNPLRRVADVVAAAGRVLIVDAMSSFGALPIDLQEIEVGAVVASSNKGLEGPPGVAFALVERGLLAGSHGVSASVSLDLHAQAQGFEANGQWRFTPPVQVVAATVEALRVLEAEGGPPERLARYRANLDALVEGMAALGFPLYLDRELQAPIIATFRPPAGAPFDFAAFYDGLAAQGFLIYPGKLTREETFRIGVIGAVEPSDIARLLEAVRRVAGPVAAAEAAA